MIVEIVDFARVINDSLFVRGFNLVFSNVFSFLLSVTILVSFVYVGITLWMVLIKVFEKRKRKKPLIRDNLPFVTVQIPTYNEIVALECAKKCLDFDYPKNKFEIIIGDDSKDKGVSRKIDAFGKKYGVKITRRGDNVGYKPGNLNHMLKYSKGEIIVILDSDYLPERNFLIEIVQPFLKDERVGGVQARWDFTNPRQNMITILSLSILAGIHYIVLPFMYRRRGVAFLCGSAEAVRRSTLEELGGWVSGAFTEDVEYSLRLVKNNYKIVYLEDLKCKGELPYVAKDLYKQQMRWAYGVVTAYRKHLKDIFLSKIDFRDKLAISFVCSGYLTSWLFVALFLTGTLSFISTPVGPIDVWGFFSGLFTNILLSSGILFMSVISFIETKNYFYIPYLVVSALTYGLVVVYYVNSGILKAILGKPMKWYMVSKGGVKLE